MKVTALVENTTKDKKLLTMHGLSLYVETANHKMLVDVGNEDLFLRNSKKLKVNIENIDIVIITHGHNDHGGGLKYFLQKNNKAKIYIQKSAFEQQYVKIKDNASYIGLDKSFMDNPQINLVDGDCKIDDEVMLITKPKISEPVPSFNLSLFQKIDEKLTHDKFLHEQSVVITEKNIVTLFAGCAHNGIMNIINAAKKKTGGKIDYVVGGFHLYNPGLNLTKFDEAEKLAKNLSDLYAKIYTCHCTGIDAFEKIHDKLGDKIEYLYTGKTISLK